MGRRRAVNATNSADRPAAPWRCAFANRASFTHYVVNSKTGRVMRLIEKYGFRAAALRAAGALGALALLTFPLSGPAAAQTKNALTAGDIERLLEDAGLSPEMSEDARTGTPVANASAGDVGFFVRALDCEKAACSTLVFFANFQLGRPVRDADYRVLNRFNDGQVFGRAYALESIDEIGVDYVVELDGGVSMDNIAANIDRWTDVIAAFIENFRAGSTPSS